MIDYDKLKKSLEHLEKQFGNYSTLNLQAALGKTASFIRDAILVYEKLTSERWLKE